MQAAFLIIHFVIILKNLLLCVHMKLPQMDLELRQKNNPKKKKKKATGDLIGNKISDKTTNFLGTLRQNSSVAVTD